MARLRRLVLVSARARAEGIAGEHRSRQRGSSPEFADFKSYTQGDDFRRIDWNTYARLNGLFVRLSEVTTELNIHLLLDASDSMDWRADDQHVTKHAYARRLAGSLGYVGLWHFDRVTIAPFGATLAAPFGPVQGRANIVPMLRYLERLPNLGGTALTTTVARYAHARRRPGFLVLVSDLLAGEPDELRALLRDLRGRGWQLAVIHTLDEAEVAPAPAHRYFDQGAGPTAVRPPVELLDAESDERLRLSPTDDVLDRYGAAVETWLAAIEAACLDEEVAYVRLLTHWAFDEIVLRLLHQHGVMA